MTILEYVGIFGLVLAGLLLFLLLWSRREQRRYHALKVARELEIWGFEELAKLFTAYAIGNYFGNSSVLRIFRELVSDLLDGGTIKMVKRVFWIALNNMCEESEEYRAKIRQALEDAELHAKKEEVTNPKVQPKFNDLNKVE